MQVYSDFLTHKRLCEIAPWNIAAAQHEARLCGATFRPSRAQYDVSGHVFVIEGPVTAKRAINAIVQRYAED